MLTCRADRKYKLYKEGERLSGSRREPSLDGKWGLQIGIHRGSFSTREAEETKWDYDSFDECQTELVKVIAYYNQRGVYIWFAYAIAPDGAEHKLVEGVPYR